MKTDFALSIRNWFGKSWKSVSVRARLWQRRFFEFVSRFAKGAGEFLLGWFVALTLALTFVPSLVIGLVAFNEGFMDYVVYLTAASAILTLVPCLIIAITRGGPGVEYHAAYLVTGFLVGAVASIVFFIAGLAQRFANEFGWVIFPTLTPLSAAFWISRIAFWCAVVVALGAIVVMKITEKNGRTEWMENTYQL